MFDKNNLKFFTGSTRQLNCSWAEMTCVRWCERTAQGTVTATASSGDNGVAWSVPSKWVMYNFKLTT